MFTCCTHGWSSHYYMCPVCCQWGTTTTANVDSNFTLKINTDANKSECEHVVAIWNNLGSIVSRCEKCGAKLKPTGWVAVSEGE